MYIISENCSSWNSKNSKNILNIINAELECKLCSSCGNFSLVKQYSIWRWEIDIPYDWEYGQWERIRLYPVQVNIFIVKCEICGKKYRVYPSFIIKGTTLTLTALIFIAFVYETSGLSLRKIPQKFCYENNIIAHSTIYKAIHGLGKSIADSDNKIRDSIKELKNRYLPSNKEEPGVSAWPPEKSIYEHTLRRETALRELLLPLANLRFEYHFCTLFYKYTRLLKTILSDLDPPISIIYTK